MYLQMFSIQCVYNVLGTYIASNYSSPKTLYNVFTAVLLKEDTSSSFKRTAVIILGIVSLVTYLNSYHVEIKTQYIWSLKFFRSKYLIINIRISFSFPFCQSSKLFQIYNKCSFQLIFVHLISWLITAVEKWADDYCPKLESLRNNERCNSDWCPT